MGDMPLKLPQYFYLLMEKPLDRFSKFGLFTIRRHSVTRKHLFLYPQADRSRLGNPKNDLCNNFFALWLTNVLKGVHFGMWFYFLLPSLILTLF